ncbi:MAG TPA: hypothetical protein VFJ94_14560 [Intrasporangium sp.]|uniref:hypothetical protein n=1 Tax=Intrasporangium sp. TaxID=1925024 RepID=UPI002D78EB8B|nr:hypothetical protein [Intrasporangium sp.]HET7399736.1 hypothetical protein [Intrasporangium sp.]
MLPGDTRRALHGVAELVLAGPQWRTSGTIRLRVTPGGFGTVAEPDVRVDGAVLVRGDRRVPIEGRSASALAEAVGLVVATLTQVYPGGSGVTVDEPLTADPVAAQHLSSCFAAGETALRRLAPHEVPVLWPEHFDVGVTVDAVNYGVSPGDSLVPEPYAYVGPHRPRTGDFWNQPFGAATPLGPVPDAEAVLAFFLAGRAAAALP